MNSLEWIDFEINFCKQTINKLKGEILYQKAMAILLHKNNINSTLINEFEISLNEEKLNHLQQIKSELEAWEIAKAKEIDILSVKTALDLEAFNIDLVKAYQLTEEEFNKLKKALEVEE